MVQRQKKRVMINCWTNKINSQRVYTQFISSQQNNVAMANHKSNKVEFFSFLYRPITKGRTQASIIIKIIEGEKKTVEKKKNEYRCFWCSITLESLGYQRKKTIFSGRSIVDTLQLTLTFLRATFENPDTVQPLTLNEHVANTDYIFSILKQTSSARTILVSNAKLNQ